MDQELRPPDASLDGFLSAEAARQSWTFPIEPHADDVSLPVSPAQEQVLVRSRLAPELPLCHESFTLQFHGELNRGAFSMALHELIRRHAILRTSFATVGGPIVQAVYEHLKLTIPYHDLASLPAEERATHAENMAQIDARKPFDPGVGPLLRARIFRLGKDVYRIALTTHQAVCDRSSASHVLLPDLSELYAAFEQGLEAPPARATAQYADFALWQQTLVRNGIIEHDLERAIERLAGAPALELPSRREEARSFAGHMVTFALTVPHAPNGTSLLLASLMAMLHRYSGQTDIVVGAIAEARGRAEFQNIVGCFENTVLIRTGLRPGMTFEELLAATRASMRAALADADVPYLDLLHRIQPRPDLQTDMIPRVILRVAADSASPDGRWRLSPSSIDTGVAPYDLALDVVFRDHHAEVLCRYASDLFDAPAIERLGQHWELMLGQALAHPHLPVNELPLLGDLERRRVCHTFNRTRRELGAAGAHELFERQVVQTPDRVAVTCDVVRITYRELNQEANRLARRLVEAGVLPEQTIVLRVERSTDLIVSLLAAWKAGATVTTESVGTEAVWLISRSMGAPDGAQVVYCDEASGGSNNLDLKVDPAAAACLVANAAGHRVEISHQNLVNLVQSLVRVPGFTSQETLLALGHLQSPLEFAELMIPLTCGGRLLLPDPAQATSLRRMDPQILSEMTQAPGVVLLGSTELWEGLMEGGWPGAPGLRAWCQGALPSPLPLCREMWRLSGWAETSGCALVAPVGSDHQLGLIGRPIDNTQVYVLNGQGQPLPVGGQGEICVAGDALATGYVGDLEQTRQRFVAAPGVFAGRVFRTGMFGRWNAQGELESVPVRHTPLRKTVEYSAEASAVETRLLPLFQGLLRHIDVNAEHNFFAEGGDLRAAAVLLQRVEREFGPRLPLTALLENPSVRQLADVLAQFQVRAAKTVPIQPEPERPTLFWVDAGNESIEWVRELAAHCPVVALRPGDRMADVHRMAVDLLNVLKNNQARGPYFLGGAGISNRVAYELSLLLNAAGDQVRGLYLVNSPLRPLVRESSGLRRWFGTRTVAPPEYHFPTSPGPVTVLQPGDASDLLERLGSTSTHYTQVPWPHSYEERAAVMLDLMTEAAAEPVAAQAMRAAG